MNDEQLTKCGIDSWMASRRYDGASTAASDQHRRLALESAAMLAQNNALLCELLMELRRLGNLIERE